MGMPVEHTRKARALLAPAALLAVIQLCVLGPDRSHTAELIRTPLLTQHGRPHAEAESVQWMVAGQFFVTRSLEFAAGGRQGEGRVGLPLGRGQYFAGNAQCSQCRALAVRLGGVSDVCSARGCALSAWMSGDRRSSPMRIRSVRLRSARLSALSC